MQQGLVIKGLGNGRSRAYPTINLDPQILGNSLPSGVYAAFVYIDGKKYKGALFFGPRKILQEENDVLEIHILDFDGQIYAKQVTFSVEAFIRDVRDFTSFADLKKQIALDIKQVLLLLA
jgi:riboflavin kinase/FMN adenylyltransferase